MVILDPSHSQEILDKQASKVHISNTSNVRIRQSRQQVLESLVIDVTAGNPDAILKTAELQNEIE